MLVNLRTVCSAVLICFIHSHVGVLLASASNNDNNIQSTHKILPSSPSPVISINSKEPDSTGSIFSVSSCSIQGNFREYMEDEIFVSEDGRFVGVFDGHGGSSVSRYLRQNLFAITLANLKNQCHDKNEKEPSNVTNTTLINNEHMHEENIKTNSDIDHLAFASNPFINDFHLALKTAFRIVDESVQRVSHWSYQGSCAVCCMLVDIDTNEVFIKSDDVNNTYHDGDLGNSVHSHRKTAIIANIGDSRAVLGRAGIAIPLSIDHKPNNPLERKRILSCGGSIKWCGAVDLKGRPIRNTGIYRVNGNLAISRAIGDRSERPHVCSDVDIFSYDLDETDDFIILASDGIWDVLSSQDVVSFIQKNVPSYREDYSIPSENINKRSRRDQLYTKDANSSENIARDLCEHAMNLGSTDNISVVIVWLK